MAGYCFTKAGCGMSTDALVYRHHQDHDEQHEDEQGQEADEVGGEEVEVDQHDLKHCDDRTSAGVWRSRT